jgi:hypothetical protein
MGLEEEKEERKGNKQKQTTQPIKGERERWNKQKNEENNFKIKREGTN